MRLLHTSDWHIGIQLEWHDYLPAQREFGNWLVDFVANEDVDVVLVSGDIYDRSNPSSEAVDLAGSIFTKLISAGVTVVVTSGNHDSAEKMNFCSEAMVAAGLYIRTEKRNLADIGEPIVISRDGQEVTIIPIPFLDPARVTEIGSAERSHGGVIKGVLDARLCQVRDLSKTIVMSHAFVRGGTESESEKVIIGGTARVAIDIFGDVGYVALGHLHKPQPIVKNQIYYSGSPLQYSFSEQHPKSVRLIEVGQRIESKEVLVPVGPQVMTLEDTLDNLVQDSKYAIYEGHLLRAILTDPVPQLNAKEYLLKRFPNLQSVRHGSLQSSGASIASSELKKLSHTETVQQYLKAVHSDAITNEIQAFINESLELAERKENE